MQLPRTILVPVDFSEHSQAALDYAVALAAKIDASVHLVHVLGFPGLGVPELGIAISATMIESLTKDNQAALDKLVASHRGQANVRDAMLRTGDARDAIVQTAQEIQADLIVMGTHGRRGLKRALLGSVAEAIVRTAPCAVLTLRAQKA